MKVKTIQITAGRTFNHPYESYSNLRPEVTMIADLDDGEDPKSATKNLQQLAEGLVEEHKNGLLRSLEELQRLGQYQAEVKGLEDQLKQAQSRLDEIRKQNPSSQITDTNGQAAAVPDLPDFAKLHPMPPGPV